MRFRTAPSGHQLGREFCHRPARGSGATLSRVRCRTCLGVLVALALLLAAAASNAGAATPSALLGGQTLTAGHSLVSPDGHYILAMQSDGNLVLYLHNGGFSVRPLWSSGTSGDRGDRAVLQTNGNLVLYSAANQALWSTNTSTAGCTNLVVQEDGNLVLYSNKKAVWASHTVNTDLRPNDVLLPGERIFSIDDQYEVTMQTDGNLVLYGATGALWSTHTWGIPGNHAILQKDGNLVVYTTAGRALWSSKTNGHPGDYAHLQNDGNFVVYSGTKALWASGTYATRPKGTPRYSRPAFLGCPPPPPPPAPAASPPSDPVVLVPQHTKVRRLHVRMSMSWTWNRDITRLHRIKISRVPRDATITVRCRGRGCPRHRAEVSDRHLRRLIRYLDGRRFRAGDRILISISRRGRRTERVSVRIRYEALPKVRLL